MKALTRDREMVLAICGVLLAVSTTAGAATDEEKCRDTLLKETGKYVKAQIKTFDLDIDDPFIGWGGSGNYGNGLAGQCPDFESLGCTNLIRHCGGANSNGDGIADCVLCIQDEVISQTVDFLYESLVHGKFGASGSPAKEHNKCQAAMVKAMRIQPVAPIAALPGREPRENHATDATRTASAQRARGCRMILA